MNKFMQEKVDFFYVMKNFLQKGFLIWKNCRKTMTSAGQHASFRLMKCFAAVLSYIKGLKQTLKTDHFDFFSTATSENKVSIDVRFEDETVWLTQDSL